MTAHPLKTENNTARMPKRLNHQTVAAFCNRIEYIKKNKIGNKHLFIDARDLIFLDALSMTVLFNVISDIKTQGWKTYICNHLDSNGNLKYPVRFMDDSEFFLLVSGKRLAPDSHCRQSSLPIKRLLPKETIGWLHFIAIKWLAHTLKVTESSLVEIQVCIEELFNNIRDHSGVEFSSIFIQFYPRAGELKICLSDNGIGLVAKIKQAHPKFNDQQAVIHSLKEGFTTKSSPRNAGMGLFTLTRTVCNNGGQIAIRTGTVEALITPDENSEPRVILLEDIEYLQGTAFEITLYSSKIDVNQSDTEDFSWE